MLCASIQPGTEIKVTPESDAPIIPNATKYQGEALFALKKVVLFADFPVKKEIKINTEKYAKIKRMMCIGFI